MNLRTAREQALIRYANQEGCNKLMSAVIYCGTNSTLRALCDVLDLEDNVRNIKASN